MNGAKRRISELEIQLTENESIKENSIELLVKMQKLAHERVGAMMFAILMFLVVSLLAVFKEIAVLGHSQGVTSPAIPFQMPAPADIFIVIEITCSGVLAIVFMSRVMRLRTKLDRLSDLPKERKRLQAAIYRLKLRVQKLSAHAS